MTAVNVPHFMNVLLTELQADAGERGVRLVGDTSTDMTIEIEAAVLHGGLIEIIGTLIRSVPNASSISLVTSLVIPKDPVKQEPALLIEITAPAMTNTIVLDADIRGMRASLAHAFTDIIVASREHTWSLSITLPNVTLHRQDGPNFTAVVVDDDPDTQDYLRAVLEMRGLKVISVSDGFDALIVIERYRPHVVLTDILMPNMNGIDLITRIKKACPEVPVIVFSGFRDNLVDAIAGLPDVILPKPLTRDLVLNALAAVLPST